jgi:hypothetical protein
VLRATDDPTRWGMVACGVQDGSILRAALAALRHRLERTGSAP